MFTGADCVHLLLSSGHPDDFVDTLDRSGPLNAECVLATHRRALSLTGVTAAQMSVIHIQTLEELLGAVPNLVLLSAEGKR